MSSLAEKKTHSPFLHKPQKTLFTKAALRLLWYSRYPREQYVQEEPPHPPDSILYQTKDGWECILRRYPAAHHGSQAVIIATGPFLHPRWMELSNKKLINDLNKNGFDVFLFTHRGHPEATDMEGFGNCTFDAIVREDIPAAIDAVKRASGRDTIYWIGHGMGGMLLYAWLGQGGSCDIKAGVTVDAPVYFSFRSKSTPFWFPTILPKSWNLPLKTMGIIHSQRRNHTSQQLAPLLSAKENRSLLVYGTTDIQLGLVQQIRRWHEEEVFCSADGNVNYLAALYGCSTPTLVMSGKHSFLGTTDQVQPTTQAFSPHSTKYITGEWDSCPFIGDQASKVTIPILDWLKDH